MTQTKEVKMEEIRKKILEQFNEKEITDPRPTYQWVKEWLPQALDSVYQAGKEEILKKLKTTRVADWSDMDMDMVDSYDDAFEQGAETQIAMILDSLSRQEGDGK